MNLPPTWNTGMPAAYPAGEVSHWPQSGDLQFQKALVPHLEKKEPTPRKRVPSQGRLNRKADSRGYREAKLLLTDKGPKSHISLRHFIIIFYMMISALPNINHRAWHTQYA